MSGLEGSAGRGCLIVTGGGRGIGAAVARQAAAEGYDVLINYLGDATAAGAVADEIERRGGRAIAVAADVGTAAGIADLFAAADRLGRLAALVNNAGAPIGAGPIDDLTPELLRHCFAVNFDAAVECTRQAAVRMRRSGAGGAIVNVTSEAARGGGNRIAAYAAAKAALTTFTLSSARELAADGIRVNAVSPGLIDTDQHRGHGAERRASMAASVPLGRLGRADEVAEAVLWLLSDRASYVTGIALPVAGGR